LVTNSVLYAEGAVRLRAMWAGEVFRVDVSDRVPTASAPDVAGRGLAIVDALATDWGVHRFDGAGRVTWFELR
jgi:hypothetical protein